MKSTLSIFKIFYNQLPPFVPEDIMNGMRQTIEKLEGDTNTIVEEVERLMIKYGYQVWPWHKAHKEFLLSTEEKMGDHFILPKLSPELQEKYKNYRQYGMTMDDLRSGRPVEDYFTSEERSELVVALVETRQEINDYVCRQIKSLEKEKFLRRVKELEDKLEDIKGHLKALRTMAEVEGEHKNLAQEIMSKVKGFEYGLCWLGPEIKHEEVENAVEFFKGRKQDLNRMKGIHIPIQVNFYE